MGKENTMQEKPVKSYKVREVGGTKVLTAPDDIDGEWMRYVSKNGLMITYRKVQ